MGYKKLSNEQELQLVQDYVNGASVKSLMEKYGFKTKKSITDKIKKHYPNDYEKIIKEAHSARKGYNYSLEKINNEFDAYYIGLLMTDGYISRETDVGIDLIDEDCIQFLSQVIGKPYKTYSYKEKNRQPRHRLILSDNTLVENLKRFGIVNNKSYILKSPNLLPEEEKFIPYIVRGIIDGDGCVSPTSYGGAQFYIVSMSEEFIDWLIYVLQNKMYMNDINKRQNEEGLWRIETSNQLNIQKLIALSYNKPFGMSRKYNILRKTFRDYNATPLLEG